jgi:hypothetical protein
MSHPFCHLILLFLCQKNPQKNCSFEGINCALCITNCALGEGLDVLDVVFEGVLVDSAGFES